MRRVRLLLCTVPLLLAATSWAQSPPDNRIAVISPGTGGELPLRSALGSHITLIFEHGEVVLSVIAGDPSAISVSVAPQGDSLSIISARVPANPTIAVVTTRREYRFKLVFGPKDDVVYVVRLAEAAAPQQVSPAPTPPAATLTSTYKFKGDNGLRPISVNDDGERTYIVWAGNQALPAVFAINALGDEETIDTSMRGGVMVIEGVFPKLVFRIGKHKATAIRPVPREGGRR